MINLFGNSLIDHAHSESGFAVSNISRILGLGNKTRLLSDHVSVFRQSWRKMMKSVRDISSLKSGLGIANEGRIAHYYRNFMQYRSNYLGLLERPRMYSVLKPPTYVLRRQPFVYNELKSLKVLPSKARKIKPNSGFVSRIAGLFRGGKRTASSLSKSERVARSITHGGAVKKMLGVTSDILNTMKYINGRYFK